VSITDVLAGISAAVGTIRSYLCDTSTKPDDLVVDPMSGTGSVLKAAVSLRRKAIGFELDPESFKVARGTQGGIEGLSARV
jgi:DNA modification methylase